MPSLKKTQTPKKKKQHQKTDMPWCFSQRAKLTLEEMPVYYFSAKEECSVKHNPSTESYA